MIYNTSIIWMRHILLRQREEVGLVRFIYSHHVPFVLGGQQTYLYSLNRIKYNILKLSNFQITVLKSKTENILSSLLSLIFILVTEYLYFVDSQNIKRQNRT